MGRVGSMQVSYRMGGGSRGSRASFACFLLATQLGDGLRLCVPLRLLVLAIHH